MQLREQIKADLTRAMKARQPATVATLRSLLAAIDNAEAVPIETHTEPMIPLVSQSKDVPRKELSAADIRQILQTEVDERRSASAEYARLGQAAEAERLQTAVTLIAAYLNA